MYTYSMDVRSALMVYTRSIVVVPLASFSLHFGGVKALSSTILQKYGKGTHCILRVQHCGMK